MNYQTCEAPPVTKYSNLARSAAGNLCKDIDDPKEVAPSLVSRAHCIKSRAENIRTRAESIDGSLFGTGAPCKMDAQKSSTDNLDWTLAEITEVLDQAYDRLSSLESRIAGGR